MDSAKDIYCHLLEYFHPRRVSLPFCLRWVYYCLANFPVYPVWAKASYKLVNMVASRFILEDDMTRIKRTLSRLQRHNLGYSLDILGEEVLSEAEAEQYKLAYENLAKQLVLSGLPIDISIKLSSLYSQFHPLNYHSKKIIWERLHNLLWYTKTHNGQVTIDMEQYFFRDLTLEIFKELVRSEDFKNWKWGLGIAFQAYLKDSLEMLFELGNFAKYNDLYFKLRLVKGAYWDQEVVLAEKYNWPVPVFTDREDTDASFKINLDIALSYYPWLKTAVGTHNLRSIAYAMARCEELGLPKQAIEFQVLYGLGEPLVDAISKMGYSVRVYIGIGNLIGGMSFLVRRLLENSSQLSSAFFTKI